MTIWQHLWPPFDAWWPNIIASVVWGVPAFTVQHVLLRRAHARQLAQHFRHHPPPVALPAATDSREDT